MAYCHQQGLNRKTFSVWARRIQDDLSLNKNAPLELLPVQLEPSAAVISNQASVMLRLEHGTQLELSTSVPPHWLAELRTVWKSHLLAYFYHHNC
jgi:hypothetical protein